MKHLRRVALGALGVVATSGAGWAGDLALVLANRAYDNAPYVRESATAIEMASALKQAGFRVFEAREQTAAGLRAAAGQFQTAIEAQGDSDRIVIVLSGHLARTTHDVFLLGSDASAPTALSIGAEGVPVSALLDMAETAPGQAVVMIATVDYDMAAGAGVTPGMGGLRAPQGVTLVTGDIAQMAPLLQDGLLQPGKSLKAAAAMAGAGVEVSGFVSPVVRLVPAKGLDVTSGADGGDQAYWDIAADIGSIEALTAYIARYPQGRFAGEAQRRIEQIRSEPERRAKAEEEALNLTREDRRQIQYFLELLGYDPRGVDGIFGRGSRAAIAAWQRGAGQPETGYLNRGQVNALQTAGARRAAELENEARRRREQQEREDQVFWNSTGRGGDEAGLRAYLQRYPDGIYAGVAQERLELIEAQLRAQTQRAERDAWDQARAADDIAGYTAFLQTYPQSGFGESARARLEELRDEESNRDQIERDRAEEKTIANTLAARQLIERRLEQLGLEPGPVDGEFTRETRRAIRRFQRAQELPATAYISRATVVRLMTPTK